MIKLPFFHRTIRSALAAWTALAGLLISVRAQPSSVPESRFWRPDGPVSAIQVTADTVYLGGQFDYVGPASGSAGVVDAASAAYTRGFPILNGSVYAAVPDGNGGWFVGGAFNRVIGLSISNLIHVKADLTVDTGFQPNPNGGVYALVITNNVLYAAGIFTQIKGQTRNRLAGINVTNADPTTFNPNVGSGQVNVMAVANNIMYLGGTFTTLSGQARNRLASVDLASGAITAWNPNATSGAVNGLAVDNGIVYVGGTFTTIGTKPRNRIASFTVGDSVASDWNPNAANGQVNVLLASGTTVYAGGTFTTIGSASRNQIAALDAASGLATAWNPAANSAINALLLSGTSLYVGGGFTTIGADVAPRFLLGAIDTDTGASTGWNPLLSGFSNPAGLEVNTIALANGQVLAAGTFPSIGGITRSNAVALSLSSGEPTAWNPQPNGAVNVLEVTPTTIYLGGTFTNVGTTIRRRLAEVDRTTGVPTAFDPNVLGRAGASVLSLALSSDRLYVGGNFTNIGATARNSAASFDLPAQTLQPWNPSPTVASATVSANVYALALGSSGVYLGGDFINLGGQARNRIGEVNTLVGTATAWNPNAPTAGQLVVALEVVGDTVYAGGTFTTIGGQTRNRLAALSVTTGLATTWNPDASGGTPRINSLAVGPHTLYAGGQFTTVGGEFRNRIAGLSISAGAADDWNPSLDTSVRTLARTADAIYLGGDFTTVGGVANAYFAVFSSKPEILYSTYKLLNSTVSFGYRSGDGQQTVVQATADFQQWQNLQTNVPSGSTNLFQESPSATASNRFYRVVLE